MNLGNRGTVTHIIATIFMILSLSRKEGKSPVSQTFAIRDRAQARDLLNLGSDRTVYVLQRDRVSACQVYLVQGY